MSASNSYSYSLQPPPPPNANSWENRDSSSYQKEWSSGNQANASGKIFQQKQQLSHESQSRIGASRAPHHAVDPNPNLYIHNVPKDATEEELKDLFGTFGTVERIRLKVNQKIGPQALYAFVTFSSTEEAQRALQRLNGYDMRTRRLRIEFQRSRGIDDEKQGGFFHGNEPGGSRNTKQFSGLMSGAAGSKEASRFHGNMGHRMNESKKRPPSYNEEAGGFHKRGRRMESNGPESARFSSGPSSGRLGNFKKRAGLPVQAMWNPSQAEEDVPESSSAGNQQPVTVYLCELLEQVKPELFRGKLRELSPSSINTGMLKHHQSNGEDQEPRLEQQPLAIPCKNQMNPASHLPLPAGSTSGIPNTYTSPAGLIQKSHEELRRAMMPTVADLTTIEKTGSEKKQMKTDFEDLSCSAELNGAKASIPTSSPGTLVWRGFLTRNGKKNTIVDMRSMQGPVEAFLKNENIGQLNISHRSSWDEILKKKIFATCYLVPAEEDINDKGGYMALAPQKKETYWRLFKEHAEYLFNKERAGVVAFSDSNYLYIIPPQVPLFNQMKTDVVPNHTSVLLGLFASGSHALASTGNGVSSTLYQKQYVPPSLPSS